MDWFILFAYVFFIYGLDVTFIKSLGPWNIFFRLRMWANRVSPGFGQIFRCPICLGTNAGILFSILNWFVFPKMPLSPFNMILCGTGLWWLAAIMDGIFCAGISYTMWNINDYIDKSTPIFEDE